MNLKQNGLDSPEKDSFDLSEAQRKKLFWPIPLSSMWGQGVSITSAVFDSGLSREASGSIQREAECGFVALQSSVAP